jgi:hypothetical protein
MLPIAAAEEFSGADSPNEVSDHSVKQIITDQSPETDAAQTPTAVDDNQPTESEGTRSFNHGKRPAEEELGRPNEVRAAKRPPRKSPLKHRLACPYRKCRPDQFSSQPRYKVCATTPHEYIRRLIDHMDRNHQISVCGGCFFAFSSPEFLKEHKDSTEHCGKCYLSFPDKVAISAHVSSCKAVESSTQEDVWQIMYETLCADFVRHNPSFDENDPIDDPIQPNNLARMRFIAESPLLPGQVDSLYKKDTPVSGNGNAPAALNSNGEGQLVTAAAVGARSMSAADPSSELQQLRAQVQQLNVRDQQLQVQVRQHQQAIALLLNVGARQEKRMAAIEELLLPTTSVITTTLENAYIEGPSYSYVQQQVSPRFGTQSVSLPDHDLFVVTPQLFTLSTFKVPSSSSSDVETLYSSAQLSRDNSALRCPSLTSESTATSQNFEVPANVARYGPVGLGEDPNDAIKERQQAIQLVWGSTTQDEPSALESSSSPGPSPGAHDDEDSVCSYCGDKKFHGRDCTNCMWTSLDGT